MLILVHFNYLKSIFTIFEFQRISSGNKITFNQRKKLMELKTVCYFNIAVYGKFNSPFSYSLDRVFHILFQPLLTWIEDSLYHLWNSMCIRIKAQNCLPRKNTLSVCTYIFCGNGWFNRCVRPPLSQLRSFLRWT